MTIKKSKAGNLYITIGNETEKRWAQETTGLAIAENGQFAYLQAENIETIEDAASLFRMMNTIVKYNPSAIDAAKEAVEFINARALELKNAK